MKALSQAEIKLLLTMMSTGATVPASRFHSQLATELVEAQALVRVRRGSGFAYRMQDAQACRSFIAQSYGVSSIEGWLSAHEGELATRAEQVQLGGDSKLRRARTFKGFLIKSPEPIKTTLRGEPFTLHTVPGTSLFIEDYEQLRLPPNVTIVGVENGENFQRAESQQSLIGIDKVVFASRYPQSADLVRWLESVPNRYVHFGDFDLAGVHIFLTEFFARLGSRAQFFIPPDIDHRLAHSGNRALYEAQYQRFNHMTITDARVRPLVAAIHHYRRCYEQEGYLPL